MNKKGFTLVELLSVITIITIITSISIPAFSNIDKAGNTSRAIYELADQLKYARSAAMSGNTYVWLGLALETPQANSISVISMASKTGRANDINDPLNISILNKLQSFKGLNLKKTIRLDKSGLENNADFIDDSDIGSFSFKILGKPVNFDKIIQFSPSGEARVISGSASRWIQVALQPSQDTKNIAVLQISGLTGQVRVFRP
jgi:prepilin-type N-terminal cleavage/methylation domain-containing protein